MAKARTKRSFFCQQCGTESLKWVGRCPGCGEWNTMVEELKPTKAEQRRGFVASESMVKPQRLQEIETKEEARIQTSMSELNRVLGGGIVRGSLVLCGGEPGIGKSTLLLQTAQDLAHKNVQVLYVSGEESPSQIKMRAERLGSFNKDMLLLCDNDMDNISASIQKSNADVVVIDSIQTMLVDEISSAPGTVTQVREVTARLMQLAKVHNVAIFIVGHVTKEGTVAGPRTLEHMVDSVLYFEGDNNNGFRILRGVKNRFGSTNEIGIFDMKDEGMVEVKNLSDIFLTKSDKNLPGTAIVATVEGTSTILMEVQALTTHSYYNNPRRVPNGIDLNRLNMLIAVLEKRCNLSLSTQDIYVNIIGGMRVDEPAVDLSVAMAIVSSYKNITIDPKTVFLGEIGLTGEIRNITNFEKRYYKFCKFTG